MSESYRLEKFKDLIGCADNRDYAEKIDEKLSKRIRDLLNHAGIDEWSMVDAHYYDYSVIPYQITIDLNIYHDCYLIFGITRDAKIVSKWVNRWDLDCDYPIENGEVIRPPQEKFEGVKTVSVEPPEIKQKFSKDLLS